MSRRVWSMEGRARREQEGEEAEVAEGKGARRPGKEWERESLRAAHHSRINPPFPVPFLPLAASSAVDSISESLRAPSVALNDNEWTDHEHRGRLVRQFWKIRWSAIGNRRFIAIVSHLDFLTAKEYRSDTRQSVGRNLKTHDSPRNCNDWRK